MRKLNALLAATTAVAAMTACTPREVGLWSDWHDQEPAAAEEFARNLPTQGASSGWQAGNCDSFAEEAAAAGLPWGTFKPIAWRESGCNPNAWVHDSDDWGGGLFGLNFISSDLRTAWARMCGATMSNIRGNVPLQMECAAAAYHELGLRPWRT